MRKLFLFSTLAVFAILGCSNNDKMPCITCGDYEYNGNWCVSDIYRQCCSIQFLERVGINCEEAGGLRKNSCPAGYDNCESQLGNILYLHSISPNANSITDTW